MINIHHLWYVYASVLNSLSYCKCSPEIWKQICVLAPRLNHDLLSDGPACLPLDFHSLLNLFRDIEVTLISVCAWPLPPNELQQFVDVLRIYIPCCFHATLCCGFYAVICVQALLASVEGLDGKDTVSEATASESVKLDEKIVTDEPIMNRQVTQDEIGQRILTALRQVRGFIIRKIF